MLLSGNKFISFAIHLQRELSRGSDVTTKKTHAKHKNPKFHLQESYYTYRADRFVWVLLVADGPADKECMHAKDGSVGIIL